MKIIELLVHASPAHHLIGDLMLGAVHITPLIVVGAWLRGGGSAWLKHMVLRRFLQRDGLLPRNVVAVLEDAANRRFLQRVGPGYQFIHPLLQEYFAQRVEENEKHTGEETL